MRALLLVATLGLSISSACAQEAADVAGYKAPRTLAGHPDLGGVWLSQSILPMEARSDAPDLVVSEERARVLSDQIVHEMEMLPFNFLDPEVPELFREAGRKKGLNTVRGERRTRQVVIPENGQLPLTPQARRRADELEQYFHSSANPPTLANNPEERPLWERCAAMHSQPPFASPQTWHPIEIIQTHDHVVVRSDYDIAPRIITYGETHDQNGFRSGPGDTIARWEGETLVLETINLHFQDRTRVFPTLFLTPNSRVIERLTRISNEELFYQYTIVDPAIYSAPWLAEYSFYRSDFELFEFACHEGNYSMLNILQAARREDTIRSR